jgi:hypothetical protein
MTYELALLVAQLPPYDAGECSLQRERCHSPTTECNTPETTTDLQHFVRLGNHFESIRLITHANSDTTLTSSTTFQEILHSPRATTRSGTTVTTSSSIISQVINESQSIMATFHIGPAPPHRPLCFEDGDVVVEFLESTKQHSLLHKNVLAAAMPPLAPAISGKWSKPASITHPNTGEKKDVWFLKLEQQDNIFCLVAKEVSGVQQAKRIELGNVLMLKLGQDTERCCTG